jgi:hypothetical protein
MFAQIIKMLKVNHIIAAKYLIKVKARQARLNNR